MTMLIETDEQADLRLRSARARVALGMAPETVEHIRSLTEPSDGRSERGFDVPHASTPLHTEKVDDADEIYATLVAYVGSWSNARHISPPAVYPVAARNFQTAHRGDGYSDAEVLGFKAGTTPHGARGLTQSLTIWLLAHHDEFDYDQGYLDEVTEVVWDNRSKYQLTRRRPVVEAMERPCPKCRRYGVRATFFGEPLHAADARSEFDISAGTRDERRNPRTRAGRRVLDAVDGVSIACTLCPWRLVKPRPDVIVKWLEHADQYSPLRNMRECERCSHPKSSHRSSQCRVAGCECWGYQEREEPMNPNETTHGVHPLLGAILDSHLAIATGAPADTETEDLR